MVANKKTCLYDKHIALGAQMAPFGGFDMPIQYTNIIDEHQAVRSACGMFDVSHMGEVVITGPQAEDYVQHVFSNDVSGALYGKILYGMLLYPDGGVVDDLLVYTQNKESYLLVINAANIDKDLAWLHEQAEGFDITITDKSDYYGELAIQGPEAEHIIEEVLHLPCADLAFYTFKEITYAGETIVVSRTGYTGEDGFELYGSHNFINETWDTLLTSGEVVPCGLGCRDTLRFEVGLPLYGMEISADINPLEAGLGIFVKTDKTNFIGKDAILRLKAEGLKRKIVGIVLEGKAIPRHGYPVEADEQIVGVVTTGYASISVGKSVCLALVDRTYAEIGTPLQIRIHKKAQPGIVTKKRFYEKKYKQ